MMYFRASGLVQELGVRTVTSDGVNTYEDSKTVFHIGGSHEVSVEIWNSSEAELKKRGLYLDCLVTGKWEPPSQEVREAFVALSEGRAPNRAQSLEELEQEFDQAFSEGRIWEYDLPWDVLPSSLQDFSNQVAVELDRSYKKAVEVLRWRYGILGPPVPYSSRKNEWSFDAQQWHPLPMDMQVHIEMGSTATIHLTDKGKIDAEALLSEDLPEPLGHVLFREAWMLRSSSPRSALVIGVASLEAGFKKFVAELVPEAEWLVEEAPTPPLVPMLKNYLPKLSTKCKVEGDVLPPPKKLRKSIDDAVTKRNKVVHMGSASVEKEVLEEWLRAIRDVLWLLDYYRGLPWALEHVREETKQSMGL